MNYSQRIFTLIQSGTRTQKSLAFALNIAGHSVNIAIRGMLRRGCIRRVRHGVYEAVQWPDDLRGRTEGSVKALRDKWRAN